MGPAVKEDPFHHWDASDDVRADIRKAWLEAWREGLARRKAAGEEAATDPRRLPDSEWD